MNKENLKCFIGFDLANGIEKTMVGISCKCGNTLSLELYKQGQCTCGNKYKVIASTIDGVQRGFQICIEEAKDE